MGLCCMLIYSLTLFNGIFLVYIIFVRQSRGADHG